MKSPFLKDEFINFNFADYLNNNLINSQAIFYALFFA